MSTPLNNQWILDRAAHGRGAACAPADAAEQADAVSPADTPRARRHERPRVVRSGRLYKRPKWIDRDT